MKNKSNTYLLVAPFYVYSKPFISNYTVIEKGNEQVKFTLVVHNRPPY